VILLKYDGELYSVRLRRITQLGLLAWLDKTTLLNWHSEAPNKMNILT